MTTNKFEKVDSGRKTCLSKESLFIHYSECRSSYYIQESDSQLGRMPFVFEGKQYNFKRTGKEFVVYVKNKIVGIAPNLKIAKQLIGN